MHEASVAQAIIGTVLREAEKHGAAGVRKMVLEIGELSFLNTEQVSFWVKTGLEKTVAQDAEIVFEKIKGALLCEECKKESPLHLAEDPVTHWALPAFRCPLCGSAAVRLIRGKEATLRSIEIVKP